jgi:hypothetical protein
VVQEADEPNPTTNPERYYLEKTQRLLESDWVVDLENDGYKCGTNEFTVAQQEFDVLNKDSKKLGMKARLHLIYANVLQRLLAATVATKSGVEDEFISVENEHWARQLLVSAGRCLVGEDDKTRVYRQTLNRIAAGALLAQWAVDGPRGGLLRISEVAQVRMDALRALVDAMPKIKDQERETSPPDGPIRIPATQWETHRRIVEQEIVDLEAALTN